MKWYGKIAFKEYEDVERGLTEPKIVAYPYFGEILELSWKELQANKINADLQVSNKISVVADQNLQTNFHQIAYITFGGAKWTVSNVTVNYPRITLSLGSLYLEEADEDET